MTSAKLHSRARSSTQIESENPHTVEGKPFKQLGSAWSCGTLDVFTPTLLPAGPRRVAATRSEALPFQTVALPHLRLDPVAASVLLPSLAYD